MRYTTLLLDADGTLLDFEKGERAALCEVYGRYGIPCNEDSIRTYSRINLSLWKQLERGEITKNELIENRFKLTFEALHLKRDDGLEVSLAYRDSLSHQHQLIEGALETIRHLFRDYTLAIITNGNRETQYLRLKDSGLYPYMKYIFISDELGFSKPDRGFFERVFAAVKEKDQSRMLVVGDSLSSDIQGAVNAGLASCWINPKGLVVPSDPRPDYVISSINEIFTVLKTG